jgi:hypothetical protein
MIVGALCAALSVSAPVTAQAATTKLTDHDIYCTFMPLTSKCAPAKPVAKPAAVKVAAAKPVAKATAMSIKMLHCEKRTDGKPFLMSCAWK